MQSVCDPQYFVLVPIHLSIYFVQSLSFNQFIYDKRLNFSCYVDLKFLFEIMIHPEQICLKIKIML